MRNLSLFLGAAALAVSPAAAQVKSNAKKAEASCETSLEKRDDTAGYRLARTCVSADGATTSAAERAVQPIEGEAELGDVAPGLIGAIIAALGVTLGIILDDDDDDDGDDGGIDPASP